MDIPSLVNDIEVKLAVPDSYEDLSDVESIASWVEDVGSLDPKESSSEYDEGTGTGAPRHPDDLPEAWYSEIDSQTPELDRPLEAAAILPPRAPQTHLSELSEQGMTQDSHRPPERLSEVVCDIHYRPWAYGSFLYKKRVLEAQEVDVTMLCKMHWEGRNVHAVMVGEEVMAQRPLEEIVMYMMKKATVMATVILPGPWSDWLSSISYDADLASWEYYRCKVLCEHSF